MKIPITKPFFDDAEQQSVIQTLRSGWVTQGPKVAEFEESINKFLGTKYAVATTSATTALFLSLYLLEIGPGDEVLVPSFSFIATANVVVHVGAKPVFVDIDPKTYNIDPQKIEKAINKKTKAIIPVDQVGLPCDLDKILAIAKKHNLYVIEDAACALGSIYKGRKIGSMADLVCFSFHPRKTVTTGEGGMIVTRHKKWSDKLRMLRHHGMSVSDSVRHKATKVVYERYPFVGFNFRMSDIQASVGIEQMRKLTKILKKRAELAKNYTKAFTKSKYVIPPYVPDGLTHNWQSYIIRVAKNSPISRDKLMQKLLDEGISTRIGIMAAHMEPAYQNMIGKIYLPESEAATKETITIPLYYHMSRDEQDFVISKILQFTES